MGICNPNNVDLKKYELKIKDCEIINLDPSIAIASKSICKIETSFSISSGFLIKFFKNDQDFFCMMTNEHIITKEMIKNKDTIHFYYDNNIYKIKKINLNSNERYIKNFRDKYFGIDATIIEILPKDNIPKDYFLLPDINYMKKFNELIDKDIAILQYPEGRLGYSYGKIKEINGYEFTHLASTESGSSGSPIFLKSKIKVIGIHQGGHKDKSKNYGYFIGPIFNFFKNFSENNLILDKDNNLEEEEINSSQMENIKNNSNESNLENKGDFKNQKEVTKNSSDRLFQNLLRAARSSCIVNSKNNAKSIGLLVSIPIYAGSRYSFMLYGLLTNYSILSEKQIKPGKELQLYFPESNQYIKYIIQNDSFVFSCPFLDVSFVEIPFQTIQNAEYLQTIKECTKGQNIIFLKNCKKDDLFVINGNIIDFYGTDICYEICENYKDYPLPGSAILSISTSFNVEIIGINKEIDLDSENQNNRALNINIIIEAINSLFSHNISKPQQTLSPAKKLSYSEIMSLEKAGLNITNNPDLFICPGTFLLITPLWFYRTQYAWFWTPTQPNDYSLEEIKKCNWSIIKANRPIMVIGGLYDSLPPAPRNVQLIRFLIDSNLSFLISQED